MTGLNGLLLALSALILWSISPFFFTNMGKRVGPFSTNLLRLALALAFLIVLMAVRALWGTDLPAPKPAAWFWLTTSGIIGLAIGDAFLYRAFVTVGPERTSQIQTLAPAATAAIAWFWLKEYLTMGQLTGMGLILAGVLMATSSAARRTSAAHRKTALLAAEAQAEAATLPVDETLGIASAGRKPESYLWTGAMAAVWSALFQGLGTVLAREAFLGQADLDPLIATTVRISAGTAVLWAYARAMGPLGPTLGDWTHPKVLRLLVAGTLFGPVMGMLCYIGALKFAPAGIVTTITFMAPLIIIPVGAMLYGTRITAATALGTALSLAGVAFLGLG